MLKAVPPLPSMCKGICFFGLCFITDNNDCRPDACSNHGICLDGVNSFACQCFSRYSGINCSNGKYINAYMCCKSGQTGRVNYFLHSDKL